jgi:hypothetical protein
LMQAAAQQGTSGGHRGIHNLPAAKGTSGWPAGRDLVTRSVVQGGVRTEE